MRRTIEQRWIVHEGDRIPLIAEARTLVSVLERKDSANTPRSPEEEIAYHAALVFLTKEFDKGPCSTTSHLTRSKDEITDGQV